jgi:hypothetical protein
MATATTRYPNRFAQEAKPAFNMIERKDPKFVQFGDGETVSGILVGIEKIDVGGKPAARYTVQDLESKEMVSFLGTYQINAKLRREDVGHVVDVRCEGSDPKVARNGKPMKLFKVLVSERTAPGYAHDGTQITDDDIPFA